MKKFVLLALFAGGIIALGQDVARTSEPIVTERGPHHRVWEHYTATTNSYQEVSVVTNTYTELQTGIHYWDGKEWVESVEEILPYPKGAIAQKGQHQVIFSPQFNVAGVIDLLTSDGQRVRGTPVGLAYHDDATGKAVLFATLKDSSGELLPPNQVIYSDCFSNILADVRFTYSKAGFEQDVILRENPPSPKEFGFDPATTRLEVWTEFQDSSEPTVEMRTYWQTPSLSGLKNTNPEVFDEELSFGAMRTGPGKAFAVEKDKMDGTELIPVIKRWQKSDGRTFLVESVWFSGVQASLEALPAAAESKEGASLNPQPTDRIVLPATRSLLAQYSPMPVARPEVQAFYHRDVPKNPIKSVETLASNANPSRSKGFVLDYTLLAAATNFTFRGDMTYYVTNSVILRGTNTIEGGTVVKFSTSSSATINFYDTLRCTASAYRPAVFTALDDDSVGEMISGSTGTPSNGSYGGTMVKLNGIGADLKYLRFAFARQAIYLYNYSGTTLAHSQILKCLTGIYGDFATFYLRNVLFQQNSNALNGTTYTGTGEHLTVSECSRLALEAYSDTSQFDLVNSLMIQITNSSTVKSSTTSCATATSTNGIFQPVGAGSCYLATNGWRGIGTTSINAALLTELTNKTTYPPFVFTNDITTDTVLAPLVPRNTGVPDLGYHYDPIDYAFSGNVLSNATLVLTNGVAAAVYGTKGIELQTGAKFYSVGTPMKLNHLVRYQAVQEQPIQWGTNNSTVSLFNLAATYAVLPSLNFRFTDVSLLAATTSKRHIVNLNAYYLVTNMTFTDCQLRGGWLYFMPYYADSRTMTLAATNNLLERCAWSMTQGYYSDTTPFAVKFYNNLFRLSGITLVDNINTAPWAIYDNLFDQTTLTSSGAITPANGYNGYYSTTALGGSGNKTLTSLPYQTGALGTYYLTNTSTLINAGSRTAAAAGLYHYTVLTNQTKEATSQVSIGLHYVGMNNGLPFDADNDGLPDYFEDRNGNGTVDSGETGYTTVDSDADGRNDGQEVVEGTNPLDALSSQPTRLGYWKFETSSFLGEDGQSPILNNGVSRVSSFDGYAAQFVSASGSVLRYREVEANGRVNITSTSLSLSFMYKPNWSSPYYQGSGPGATACLWEFGDPFGTGGGMSLSIDTYGTNMIFLTSDGTTTITNSGAISMYSNTWYQITLSMNKSPWYSNPVLYVWVDYNYKPINIESLASIPTPTALARSAGFCIGNKSSTTAPACGLIDEFKTFNYPIGGTATMWNDRTLMTASTVSNPLGVILQMRYSPGRIYNIWRRLYGDTNWTVLATNISSYTYLDTNVTNGGRYEYNLIYNTRTSPPDCAIVCGVNASCAAYRGRAILLVDSTLSSALSAELTQFQNDLIGDGWAITRHDVARHNDVNWSVNTNNISTIRNLIISDYGSDPTTKSVVIIGHVPIPYSGTVPVDGHTAINKPPGHEGAWPADGYYGDIDGIWSDALTSLNTYSDYSNNLPGDGKFDNDMFPTNSIGVAHLELSVGRIDFANLPAFSKTETELIKQYLNKDHKYRYAYSSYVGRGVSGSYFGDIYTDQTIAKNANQNIAALYGYDNGQIYGGHCFKEHVNSMFGILGGYGAPDSTANFDGCPWLRYATTNLASTTDNEPAIGIYILKSSYLGDIMYYTNNNFMRSALGTQNYGLAAVWTMDYQWRFEGMATGDTLGDSLVRTINNASVSSTRQIMLCGDPTLRLNPVTPVVNASITASNAANVTIRWLGSYDQQIKYNIYRSQSISGPFTYCISSSPINGTTYVDNNPTSNNNIYQVRALKIITDGSGTYTNMSQGVIAQ
jgi:hypothetical protein